MPPALALVFSLVAIAALILQDRRANHDVSTTLWIPFLWLFFIGTRFPSQWLDLGSTTTSPSDSLESSSIDQLVFLALYTAGITVLVSRRLPLRDAMSANSLVFAFLAYGLISVLWSDYPWTALKRFTKVLEHLVMVLVVLTEKELSQALDALLRRFLASSIILSVLFLKYYPELGRSFSFWTGQASNAGVTLDKNALGHICVIGAIFYTSSLISQRHRSFGRPQSHRWMIDLLMLLAVTWLLSIANAKTALVCSVLGASIVVLFTRTRLMACRPAAVMAGMGAIVTLGAVLESIFQFREAGVEMLGRDPTLTDRVFVWADVLSLSENVLIGSGFESFWLGPRLMTMWSKYWWQPNQAHNGYIETYVNLGAIGLILLILLILISLWRSLRLIQQRDPFGSVKFALIVAIAVLNYTDATFKAVHILFFIFFLASIQMRGSVMEGRYTKPVTQPRRRTSTERF